MRRLSHLRWLFAWIAILGMLSLPLAAATAMAADHGRTATVDLAQQGPVLTVPDSDPCCAAHQFGTTECGKVACVGAVGCMAKCVPGTAALITKAATKAFGSHLIPSDEVTVALYGPEPPMEPPRS